MKYHTLRTCAMQRGDGQHGPHGGRPAQRDDFLRGRKFSSDDLQLMLLGLLARGPGHGYDLIKELQMRSEAVYTPSAGMVYPALAYIQDLGLAQVTLDGNKKSYSLTPQGQAHVDGMRERIDTLFAGLAHMARKMKYMRGAMAEEGGRDGEWLALFVEARLALKRALLMKSGAGHEEQRRIAAILQRATDAINAIEQSPSTPPEEKA